LCCHADPKLRTVLWGWRSARLSESELTQLGDLEAWLAGEPEALATLLAPRERRALRDRVATLCQKAVFPEPVHGLPALPWPAF
jgi:hypothetical protein